MFCSKFARYGLASAALLTLLVKSPGVTLASEPLTSLEIFVAMCVVPVFTLVVRAVPPLSLLQEERR